MPQVFHVLRCYSCKTFQVHQVKKATRWSCKLCGEKQSVKNVYGEGTGADCRHHVQKLNMLRAAEDEATVLPKYETACCDSRPAAEDITQSQRESSDVSVSKWMQYMTQVKDTEGTDDNTSDDIKFTLDRRTFEESKKERKRGRPDRLVSLAQGLDNSPMLRTCTTAFQRSHDDVRLNRGRKRKCNSAVAHPGNPQHHAINISSRSCSYNGEFKPNSQLDTNRNISREPRVDRVTNISTDMPIQVTGGLLRDNKSSHAQVASSRTTFLPESTNTTHASRNVLLSRHPNVHQITKGIVSALSGDCKQGIENRRNSEKELSRGEVLSSGSKWAQFVTPEDDADSSDSSANESDWSMLKDNNKNVPNISGACNQQRFKGESSQNVPVIFSGNISENRLKTQHCPNFSLAGDGEDDEDLDSVIADWPIA